MNEASGADRSLAEIIGGRRTIHNFKEEPVPELARIVRAIDIARWAPNHHVTEPWHFYIPGRETVRRICALKAELTRQAKGEKAAAMVLQRWQQIPGWLILTCANSRDPVREREDFAACCCAAQNMLLLLWADGIGAKWTTGELTRDDRFYELARIDRGKEHVVGLFWYGFAAEIPVTRRKEVTSAITVLP